MPASDSTTVLSNANTQLPSSHRTSAYRSKYLQEKEHEQEETSSSQPSKDASSSAAAEQKDGSANCSFAHLVYLQEIRVKFVYEG